MQRGARLLTRSVVAGACSARLQVNGNKKIFKMVESQRRNGRGARVAFGSSVAAYMAFSASATCDGNKTIESQAEDIYKRPEIYSKQDVFDFLERAVSSDRTNIELVWRFARACYDLAGEPDTTKERHKELIYQSNELIQEALKSDGDNFAVQKWCGIILSAIGDIEGTKVSIANSYKVKEHWVRAVELAPEDATSNHLLGRWCYSIASISWVSRNIATALFGTPPKASYEEALVHFERAEQLQPAFWKKNLVMGAKCHLQKAAKDKAAAKEWLEKALALPCLTEEDREAHKEAEGLMKQV